MLSKFVIDIFLMSEKIDPDDLRRSDEKPMSPVTDSFLRSLFVLSGTDILCFSVEFVLVLFTFGDNCSTGSDNEDLLLVDTSSPLIAIPFS